MEPVALFKYAEQWQYECDRQCELEKLEEWLAGDSQMKDFVFVAQYVAIYGDGKVPQHCESLVCEKVH